jgi:hypothetical protein
VSSNTAWSFLLISRDRSKVIVPSVWWELYTDPIMLCFLAICAWEDKTNKILLYSVDYLICQQGGLVGQMVPQKMNANFINADKPTVKNCRLLLQMFLKTASIYSKHSTVVINFFNITIPLNLKYMLTHIDYYCNSVSFFSYGYCLWQNKLVLRVDWKNITCTSDWGEL